MAFYVNVLVQLRIAGERRYIRHLRIYARTGRLGKFIQVGHLFDGTSFLQVAPGEHSPGFALCQFRRDSRAKIIKKIVQGIGIRIH
jgi:hypothetical protein